MNGDPAEARWLRSSYSQGGADCVEVAFLRSGRVGVRDSKDPAGPVLIFNPGEWDAFVAGVDGVEVNPLN